MDAKDQSSLDRRLARIEGQVRGLRRLVQEDAYCVDILTQLAATRSALDQVGAELAASHVKHCMLGHAHGEGHPKAIPMSEDELVEELRVTLSRLMR